MRKYFLCISAIGGIFLLAAWINIEATRTGYKVERERAEIQTLKNSNEYLRHKIQTALAPARLQYTAQRKLGMDMPDPEQIVLLGENKRPIDLQNALARISFQSIARLMRLSRS